MTFCSAITRWPTMLTVCGMSRSGSEYLLTDVDNAEAESETSTLAETLLSSSSTEVGLVKRQ